MSDAIVGATVLGSNAYVVTRGVVPARLAVIDMSTRTVATTATLPTGEGGWATTVSGGLVYVGMYAVPDLYRYDPATGRVTLIGRLGGTSGYIWALTTAPDGTVYAATYPDGGIWEVKPSTGAFRRIARPVPGAQYARYIAADAANVYASVYSPGRLVSVNRTSGAVRNLSPFGDQPFGPVVVDGDRLVTTFGRQLVTMKKNGSNLRTTELPTNEALIDAIAVAPDGTIYSTTRRSGSVYRYRSGDAGLTLLATPSPNDETRGLFLLPDGRLFGAAGSGGVWWVTPSTRTFTFTDLVSAGLTPGPDRPQSIAYDQDGQVFVGGHWAIDTYKPATGERTRVRVPGEVKAMLVLDHLVYAALYPSTQLIVFDPATQEVRTLATIQTGQERPWNMDYDPQTGLIAVATAPGTGNLTGALALYSPSSGKLDVYPGIMSGESVLSVDTENGIAYLGGDVIGGGDVTPVQSSASVLAFDLTTRRTLWQVRPLAGQRTIQDLTIANGDAYVVDKRDAGVWFRMSLTTLSVVQQGNVGSYGETLLHQGQVFTSVFIGDVFQLGPDLAQQKLVASGLGDQWLTDPQLAPETGWFAWGAQGRDLARIRIDPACGVTAAPRKSRPRFDLDL
ncbi:Sugar lactone lactonase YvrE [Actinopolymorpha cephalotaxi]|uniref:Sugar lactone lactonase YvrE n=1 Tax=Actinopolymorpha cephalotaxi TaxID=504797 RepID=A0A1I2ZTF5_9ACTN|nr:Sugar lactone lactonase YvrE [Actinopolymorpha cephalotaxi]